MGTANEISGSEDESKADTEGEPKKDVVEEEIFDKPTQKKDKKIKDDTKAKKSAAAFTSSDSAEDSDEDRLGIEAMSPDMKKISKKEERKRKEKEEKKQREKEEKMKRKEEKLKKKEGK